MVGKYLFGLTRKQCGVIYSASKRGDINLTPEIISFLYNKVCDFRRYYIDTTSETKSEMQCMSEALNAIFNSDYEKAQRLIEAAYQIEIK